MQSTHNFAPAEALHPDLAEVALVGAPTIAAVAQVTVQWWYAEVAAGRAPKPAVKRHRLTRWKVSEVAAFWRSFAAAGQAAER